jgi:hypothetical protein
MNAENDVLNAPAVSYGDRIKAAIALAAGQSPFALEEVKRILGPVEAYMERLEFERDQAEVVAEAYEEDCRTCEFANNEAIADMHKLMDRIEALDCENRTLRGELAIAVERYETLKRLHEELRDEMVDLVDKEEE